MQITMEELNNELPNEHHGGRPVSGASTVGRYPVQSGGVKGSPASLIDAVI
jgi:hypothetical protein